MTLWGHSGEHLQVVLSWFPAYISCLAWVCLKQYAILQAVRQLGRALYSIYNNLRAVQDTGSKGVRQRVTA